MSVADIKSQLVSALLTVSRLEHELAESDRGLVALSNELEERVAVRTSQLQAARVELEETNLGLMALHAEIATTEARLRTVVNSAHDAIVMANGQGIILTWNPAAERIFGHSTAQALGQALSLLIPESLRAAHTEGFAHFQRTGQGQLLGKVVELMGLHRDGHEFPIELALSCWESDGERLSTAIIRDITERKKLDQLKAEFVSTVSHELRTPLTSINGALGLLCSGTLGAVSSEISGLLLLVYKNSQRLTLLINDLLDMEKLSAGKVHFDLRQQPLQPLLEMVLQTMAGYAQSYQVKLKLNNLLDGALVNVDGSRLQQVLGNFLSNAIKFSPAGAEVELRVEPATQINAGVRLAVIDKGPGIADSFRPRVFQRFAQADAAHQSSRGGTGLGLAIAKEMVEKMHGLVGFESELGKGSVFYLELPAGQPC